MGEQAVNPSQNHPTPNPEVDKGFTLCLAALEGFFLLLLWLFPVSLVLIGLGRRADVYLFTSVLCIGEEGVREITNYFCPHLRLVVSTCARPLSLSSRVTAGILGRTGSVRGAG